MMYVMYGLQLPGMFENESCTVCCKSCGACRFPGVFQCTVESCTLEVVCYVWPAVFWHVREWKLYWMMHAAKLKAVVHDVRCVWAAGFWHVRE